MYLVRIGYRTLNLEYLIKADDSARGAPIAEAPKDGIRVSVYPGESFDVRGDDAVRLRLHLDDQIKPLPSPGPEGPHGGSHRARPKGALRPRGSSAPKSRSKEE